MSSLKGNICSSQDLDREGDPTMRTLDGDRPRACGARLWTRVRPGANVGLMTVVADAVSESHGHVTA